MLKRIRPERGRDLRDLRELPDVGEFLDRGEPVSFGPLCKVGDRYLFCRVSRDSDGDDVVESFWQTNYDPDSDEEPEDGERAFRAARLR